VFGSQLGDGIRDKIVKALLDKLGERMSAKLGWEMRGNIGNGSWLGESLGAKLSGAIEQS
jgi:hypothetical protein